MPLKGSSLSFAVVLFWHRSFPPPYFWSRRRPWEKILIWQYRRGCKAKGALNQGGMPNRSKGGGGFTDISYMFYHLI